MAGVLISSVSLFRELNASLLQVDIALKGLLTVFLGFASCDKQQYILKGSSTYPILDQLSLVIWRWEFERSIHLPTRQIANFWADQLSRGVPISIEWSISDRDFSPSFR